MKFTQRNTLTKWKHNSKDIPILIRPTTANFKYIHLLFNNKSQICYYACNIIKWVSLSVLSNVDKKYTQSIHTNTKTNHREFLLSYWMFNAVGIEPVFLAFWGNWGLHILSVCSAMWCCAVWCCMVHKSVAGCMKWCGTVVTVRCDMQCHAICALWCNASVTAFCVHMCVSYPEN